MDEPWDLKELFIGSKWKADADLMPREFQACISQFLRKLQPQQFRSLRLKPSLAHLIAKLLYNLKDSPAFIIFPMDKN